VGDWPMTLCGGGSKAFRPVDSPVRPGAEGGTAVAAWRRLGNMSTFARRQVGPMCGSMADQQVRVVEAECTPGG
jgi:hypothetical protein